MSRQRYHVVSEKGIEKIYYIRKFKQKGIKNKQKSDRIDFSNGAQKGRECNILTELSSPLMFMQIAGEHEPAGSILLL